MTPRQLIERMAERHGRGEQWITSYDLDDRSPPHPALTLNRLWHLGLVWRQPVGQSARRRVLYEYRLAEQVEPILMDGAPVHLERVSRR